MKRGAIGLGILLLGAGCYPSSGAPVLSSSELGVNRCHEGVELHELVIAAGVPPQGRAWGTPSVAETMEQRLFDLQQETTLRLPAPSDFTKRVCIDLQRQLEAGCTVRSWSGAGFCSFATTAEASTDSDGRYLRRGSEGRVHLVASPVADARTLLLLTATEWAN